MSGSTGYIRTIEDMERLYYGAGSGQNAWAYAESGGMREMLRSLGREDK